MPVPSLRISRSLPLTTSMLSMTARASNWRRASCGVDAPAPSRAIALMAFFAVPYSIYAGMSFIPNSSSATRRASTMMRPMRVTPRRLLQAVFFQAARSRIVVLLSSERPEAPQLVQVEPDEERLADDVLIGHEPPDPAVARIVPVIAHHEVMPRRYRARQAVRIVVAIGRVRERARRRHQSRRIVLDQDLVLDIVQGLDEALGELHALLGQVVVDLAHRHRVAVDGETFVAVFDAIPRYPDHALDEVERRLLRIAENHHIAALRIVQ